jgi:hypothetical protein
MVISPGRPSRSLALLKPGGMRLIPADWGEVIGVVFQVGVYILSLPGRGTTPGYALSGWVRSLCPGRGWRVAAERCNGRVRRGPCCGLSPGSAQRRKPWSSRPVLRELAQLSWERLRAPGWLWRQFRLLTAGEDASLARWATSGGRRFSVPGTKVLLAVGPDQRGCDGLLYRGEGSRRTRWAGNGGQLLADASCTEGGGAIVSALADLPRKGSRPSAPSLTAKTTDTAREHREDAAQEPKQGLPGGE